MSSANVLQPLLQGITWSHELSDKTIKKHVDTLRTTLTHALRNDRSLNLNSLRRQFRLAERKCYDELAKYYRGVVEKTELGDWCHHLQALEIIREPNMLEGIPHNLQMPFTFMILWVFTRGDIFGGYNLECKASADDVPLGEGAFLLDHAIVLLPKIFNRNMHVMYESVSFVYIGEDGDERKGGESEDEESDLDSSRSSDGARDFESNDDDEPEEDERKEGEPEEDEQEEDEQEEDASSAVLLEAIEKDINIYYYFQSEEEEHSDEFKSWSGAFETYRTRRDLDITTLIDYRGLGILLLQDEYRKNVETWSDEAKNAFGGKVNEWMDWYKSLNRELYPFIPSRTRALEIFIERYFTVSDNKL